MVSFHQSRMYEEFQTRSSNPRNGIKRHATIAEAFAEAKADPDVWKLSFEWEGISMVWRPKTRKYAWEKRRLYL